MTRDIWFLRAAIAFTLVFSAALVWAFLTPIAQLPKVPDISDYVWHIAIFAVLVIPLCTILPAQRIFLVGSAIAFGIILEILQPYFGRGFEIHDLASNVLGVGLGWLASRKLAAIVER